MITTARLGESQQARPFRPFRILLTDGLHHDIPHPKFAWLSGSWRYVGWIDKAREPAALRITRIEPLAPPGARKPRKPEK